MAARETAASASYETTGAMEKNTNTKEEKRTNRLNVGVDERPLVGRPLLALLLVQAHGGTSVALGPPGGRNGGGGEPVQHAQEKSQGKSQQAGVDQHVTRGCGLTTRTERPESASGSCPT